MEQTTIKPDQRWFNLPDSNTLRRAGGNGPHHPSQLYAIIGYVQSGMNLLDYGCGSATTYEALKLDLPNLEVKYRGADIIPKNTEYCKSIYPERAYRDW